MSANPIQLIPQAWQMMSRRKRLWMIAGQKCHWCKEPTRMSDDHAWDAATIDHVIPRYKGGSKEEENCVSACNRCNNRRNSEDMMGLAEGALLGKYKLGEKSSSNAAKAHTSKYVALTKDDKKAIMAGRPAVTKVPVAQTHLDQRDQALKEIKKLREDIGILQSDAHLDRIQLNDKDAEILSLKNELVAITVMRLIRSRIAAWLLR